jgi:catalase
MLGITSHQKTEMASLVENGVQKVKEAAGVSTTMSAKIKDLERNTKNTESSQPITTDYGIRVSDTDHWLKIVNENGTGPHLLEDQIGREKV